MKRSGSGSMQICISLHEDKIYKIEDSEDPPYPSICFECSEVLEEPPKDKVFIVVCTKGTILRGSELIEVRRGAYVPKLSTKGMTVNGDCLVCVPKT